MKYISINMVCETIKFKYNGTLSIIEKNVV